MAAGSTSTDTMNGQPSLGAKEPTPGVKVQMVDGVVKELCAQITAIVFTKLKESTEAYLARSHHRHSPAALRQRFIKGSKPSMPRSSPACASRQRNVRDERHDVCGQCVWRRPRYQASMNCLLRIRSSTEPIEHDHGLNYFKKQLISPSKQKGLARCKLPEIKFGSVDSL